MKKENNDSYKNKVDYQPINLNKQNPLISKSSNLLELLKNKKGQNINIDISMLSNKGSLTNLIEKAKKYQIHPNSNLDKNIEKEKIYQNIEKNEQKNLNIKSNIKGNDQMEIFEKFNKTKNEKYFINDENILIEDNSEETNEKTFNKNSNNLNLETSSNGTMTKLEQKSIKERSGNYSNEEDDIESNTPSQKENSNKKYSRKDINMVNDKFSKSNSNKKTKNYKISDENYNPNFAIEYETVKDIYSIKSCNTVLEYSFREDQNVGSQPLMEDKSKSIENFNNNINQMLFELFDGHGGEDISNFLQQNFAQIYKQFLEINNGDIPKSLSNSFKEVDEMIKESLENIEGMGSTGTIIHLLWENDTNLMVYTGNVGDSRVSLISPTHIIRLSYDHRMTDEKEKKRIIESGMEVIDNRIGGELMLTRIFGDYEFKSTERKGLICEPFLSKIKIDLNKKDQFLILASDGIWDLVSEEEIQQMIRMNISSEKLCALIVKKALDKDSWDNMSVFAIKVT